MPRPVSWGSGRQHCKASNPYGQCIVDRAVPVQFKSLRVRDMDVGTLRIRRNSSESVRSEYSRTLFQPEGRHRIAHGASHGNSACAEEPPEGAEDGGVPIFRPVPGLREPGDLPTAHAMGYVLSLCELRFGALPESPLSCCAPKSALACIRSECYNRIRIPEIAGTP
jgi:hypothetical protein